MKIRSFALTLISALGLCVACGSNNETPTDSSVPTDSAIDSGGGDAGGDASTTDAGTGDGGSMCVSPNDAYTRATLETASTAAKACTTASTDLDVVCSNDLEGRAAMCAIQSCIAHIGVEADFKSCVTTCMTTPTATAPAVPSTGCAGCYSDSAWCSVPCASQCLSDTSAPACVSCRKTNNCYSTFFACSGLPDTTPP